MIEAGPAPSPDTYDPRPLDIAGVELGPEVERLTELLARHVHDTWAQARLAEGWVYGPARDDAGKTHPCLVPYGELPESEKEYDRRVALGTLKAIVAAGYHVVPPQPDAAGILSDDASAATIAALKRQLRHAALDLQTLSALWRGHSRPSWGADPELYALLGNRLLDAGSPLLAHDVLAEGLRHRPGDVRLRQLLGWALAGSGAPRRANAVLSGLHVEGHEDEETLGLLARTHKDLARHAADAAEHRQHLQLAHELYLRAFRLTGGEGFYSGVNAATSALLLGQRSVADELAREARASCRIAYERCVGEGGDCYYQLATLAETALILGETSEAERWYAEAAEAGRGRFGRLMSTRRNARLILGATRRPREWIDDLIRIPRVVVFAGHMIDQPDRLTPRFAADAEGAVAAAIARRLAEIDAGFGFASAACGGDILFLEAIDRRMGETHVVLPYEREQFVQDSVDCGPGGGWVTRFDHVLERAAEVVVATGQRFAAGSKLYDYANLLLLGLATLQSQALDTELVPLVLWDGNPGDRPGGTAGVVECCQALGYAVEMIDVPAAPAAPAQPVRASSAGAASDDCDVHIMGILFADVANFSALRDHEISLFVRHFLGSVDELIRHSPHAPIIKNTWGDGLYFVFSSVRDAGVFALDLCDLAGATDWAAKGLRPDLQIRVAVHAGPLFACVDPVTGQRTFTGKHAARAARIEPVTPVGLAYASQEFAALAAASRVADFSCEFVGRIALPKTGGVLPVYLLTRTLVGRGEAVPVTRRA